MARAPATKKTICENRRARYDYELLETFEAGLVMEGWEVKALREGRGQIVNAYVRFVGNELFLIGAQIQPPSHLSRQTNHVSDRSRKLLMRRKEINKIKSGLQTKGLTCLPLRLKWQRHLVKCDLALARGKKQHDKRAVLKERDIQRSLRRDWSKSG